jgi:hypothetical protein
MDKIIAKSKITCPFCGFTKEEIMPDNSCVYFYECELCKKILKPIKGNCCVFCSYGDIKCPPMQKGANPHSCCSN